jgi:hypothetical protein
MFGISNNKCIFVKQMTNSMDLIYLIIGTPITIAVMYGWHCIKLNSKRYEQTPEAKPYEFEKDEIIPEFDEFTQMLYQRRMYKGRADK